MENITSYSPYKKYEFYFNFAYFVTHSPKYTWNINRFIDMIHSRNNRAIMLYCFNAKVAEIELLINYCDVELNGTFAKFIYSFEFYDCPVYCTT